MLSILLIATSQVFICSGEAMIDFFRYQVFFSTTLRHCSWGHLFHRGDKSSLCLSGSTSDVLNI